VIALNQNSVGAGVVGFGLLIFAASTVFAVLRRSVNNIWRAQMQNSSGESVYRMALFFMLNKLFAFVLVLGTALLLLASLITNIVIKTILKLVANFQETFAFIDLDESSLIWGLQASSSFLILALAICVLFKVLPYSRLNWRDVWLGALLTAVLLAGLQQLVSNSVVSIGGRFLSYGVVGSVMILLLWLFLDRNGILVHIKSRLLMVEGKLGIVLLFFLKLK
jgi:membrane protein